MNTANTISLVDNYYGLLSTLSNENKLKLIAKLSNSIIKAPAKKKNIVDKLYGSFKSDKSAEDMAKEMRESRVFNRTIESFDE